MEKYALSIKILFLFSFFWVIPETNWGQELLLSTKVIGKVKKCVLKTYSVKIALDEYDIDELKFKESFEYYMDGAIKNINIYRDNYVMKINYLQNGEAASVTWMFENGYIKSARDTFIYNQIGEIQKKTTSVLYEGSWITTDIYEFQYEKEGVLQRIYHKYTSEYSGGDIRPFKRNEIYPYMTNLNFSNAIAGEIIENMRNKIEETNEIMYREFSNAIANKPFETKKPNLEGLSTFTDITFKREYDSSGNWTKTTLFIGKEPTRIYIRELSYYD